MKGDILLWLDVETSGLDPNDDHLLEIAIVPTRLDRHLPILGETFVRQFELPALLRMAHVDPHVVEMHAMSGLWRACRSGQEASLVWADLGRVARQTWELHEAASVALAGRSVHFDRSWLLAQAFPAVVEQLHLSHRHFDLTSIKAFASAAGLRFGVPEDAHRALADVEADIVLARELLQAVRA